MFDPDVVVARQQEVGGAKSTTPPLLLLIAEIRTPSTALIELNRKKAAYERFGVPSYWIVDPAPVTPSLTGVRATRGRLRAGKQGDR